MWFPLSLLFEPYIRSWPEGLNCLTWVQVQFWSVWLLQEGWIPDHGNRAIFRIEKMDRFKLSVRIDIELLLQTRNIQHLYDADQIPSNHKLVWKAWANFHRRFDALEFSMSTIWYHTRYYFESINLKRSVFIITFHWKLFLDWIVTKILFLIT